MKTIQDAINKAAHDVGLGHWPERKDEQPCGCHWARKSHGWGGYYYDRVLCKGGECRQPLPTAQ